jgi:AcrR family transcriptional regulator
LTYFCAVIKYPFKERNKMIKDNDEIRDHIILAAGTIFSHFGFKKATMEEIASATRKGKSSIYYYFKSKEEIFQAVVEKEAEELRGELMEEISKYDDPMEQLRGYILVRMRKLKKVTNFYDALKSDYLSHLEFINKIRKRFDEDEIHIVTQILQTGINNGKFDVESPELSAVAIVTAMKGLEIPLFIQKSQGNLEIRLDSLIKFLFYGLVKR